MKLFYTFFLFLFSFSILSSQSWVELGENLLPDEYGIYSISVVDENTVWAIAHDFGFSGQVPLDHICKLLKTDDGGDTWEVFDVTEAEGRISFNIVAIDNQKAFITTQDYNNGLGRAIFKTEDGGQTWEQVYLHVSAGVWLRFFTDQDAVIINRSSIATSNDGGESWELIDNENKPEFWNGEYTIISSGDNSCVTIDNHIWFGTSKGRVFHSSDKGLTWEVSEVGAGEFATITSVAFKDSKNGVALVTLNGLTTLSMTEDGGSTWTLLEYAIPHPINIIEYVPGSDETIIGGTAGFVSSSFQSSAYSTDFGKNWTQIDQYNSFGSIQFISPTVGFAARHYLEDGSMNAIFSWEGDILHSKNIKFAEHSLLVYPNPAIDEIIIDVSKFSNHKSVVIQVYDILGKKVLEKNVENQSEVKLDLKSLSTGQYIIHCTDGLRYDITNITLQSY